MFTVDASNQVRYGGDTLYIVDSVDFSFETPIDINGVPSVSDFDLNQVTAGQPQTPNQTGIFTFTDANQAGEYNVRMFNNPGRYTELVTNNFWVMCPEIVDSLTMTICKNDTATIGTSKYFATGLYADTLAQAGTNCDSIVYLDLTVIDMVTNINAQVCNGDSLVVNGITYNAANPTGSDTINNVGPFMCDSVLNVSLTFFNTITTNLTPTLCFGDSIEIVGKFYAATGVYADTVTAVGGCDSVINTNLTILNDKVGAVSGNLCAEDTIMVNNVAYHGGNLTGTEVITGVGAFMCDSTVTINLTGLTALVGSVTDTICNEGSVTVNGTVYDQATPSGTEVFANIGADNCDSTVTVNLHVLPAITGTVNTTICFQDTVMVNGTPYWSGSPNGTETFAGVGHGSFSCDSVVTVMLNVLPDNVVNISPVLCNGDSITVGTSVYNVAGNYSDTLVDAAGCDSTVNTNLSFVTAYTVNNVFTICSHESVTVGSTVYNTTGIYADTLSAIGGCDSIVNTDLTVIPEKTGTYVGPICDNNSVTINGTVYDINNSTGTEVLLAGLYSCDSTVTINLQFIPSLTTIVNDTICAGDSVIVNNVVYNMANPTGQEIIPAVLANGCDLIIDVALVVNAPNTGVTKVGGVLTSNHSVGGATYQWIDCNNGDSIIVGETNRIYKPTVNGNYAVIVTTSCGTDTSACTLVNNVGIDEIVTEEFVMYPNPVKDQLTIELANAGMVSEITIRTIEGKLVKTLTESSNTLVIDVAGWSKGIYFVNVSNDDYNKTLKLIKN